MAKLATELVMMTLREEQQTIIESGLLKDIHTAIDKAKKELAKQGFDIDFISISHNNEGGFDIDAGLNKL